jgi:hypothetical protein
MVVSVVVASAVSTLFDDSNTTIRLSMLLVLTYACLFVCFLLSLSVLLFYDFSVSGALEK